MAGKELPNYNTAIAGMLQWPSEIEMKFPRVGMRFYPLRADLVQLQKVCDAYLNFSHDAPDDRPPYYFKPGAPFVLMQTVNYDRLEIEEIGWLTQHEAIFSIPLEWYHLENGKWLFKDWAMTYPFIYLDHPISIWMGREMYGWPKVPVRVPRVFPLRNPPDPQGSVEFNLGAHSVNRANQPEPFRPFIEIRQHADRLVPNSVSDFYSAVPRAIAGGLAGASTIVESLSSLFFRSAPQKRESESLPAMVGTGVNYISKWLPEFWTMMVPGLGAGRQKFTPSPFMRNNIVMKQFRDAHDVKSACYQALVKSEIAIDEVLDAGLLFNPLSGDASGGITVRLHRSETQSIIETLGLATAAVALERGTSVTTLKPFCPFWWNLNLSYGKAETLSWRSRATRFSSPEKQGPPVQRVNDYVVIGSGAREEIAGTETFPAFTMRVLPLAADETVLKQLCDELFADTPYSFTPAAPFVVLVANQFKDMVAATNPTDQWADSELTFAIVAHCEKRDSSSGSRLVILPMLGFAGSEWSAISHREVDGRFTLAADFVAPHQHGLQNLPPTDDPDWRRLFTLRTSICPTLDEEEQTRRWILMDVAQHTADSAQPVTASAPIDEWLQQLGLAAMAQNRRFEIVAHKQFRDATDASRACYQALVALDQKYRESPEIAWIHERLQVTIHEFDSMQIAKRFGLRSDREVTNRFGRNALIFEPIKPFWVRGAMTQGPGSNLCWRAGTMDWQPGDYSK